LLVSIGILSRALVSGSRSVLLLLRVLALIVCRVVVAVSLLLVPLVAALLWLTPLVSASIATLHTSVSRIRARGSELLRLLRLWDV